jgi:hypothetical protein
VWETAWYVPIARPNCLRSFAYSTAIAIARSATPTDSAAFITVACSRARSTSPPSGEREPPETRNIRRVGSRPWTGSTEAPSTTAPSQSTSTSAVPASAASSPITTAPRRPPETSAPSSPATQVDCSGVGASA